ncbi:pantothenate kinase 2-like isoform X2 [Durio zibethinus]|uniref:Pantothenate kinase 2-like isoform X2 n=1 Tax=Durio zibethinus TaxID=66656 RepID=A0A6P5Y122_DURZI|nr:pantothenate kinase 2-like isoform X2 [Durio zibethinus]
MDLLADVSNPQNFEPQSQISHLALDIGGSLIKLVYFWRNNDRGRDDDEQRSHNESVGVSDSDTGQPVLEGRLHFAKFETSKINDFLEFIHCKKLCLGGFRDCTAPSSDKIFIKATGGGAYKFADLFKEKLGITLDKEDEMDCLVTGANFLLKVDGDGKFERVSGTNLGGGTFWGLGRLLTKDENFDGLLELSHQGNNRVVDMLVGDIYGGTGYGKIGLSATTIASSFGKVISDDKELEDYKPEDISRSLLRMISNNIGQISYLNALRFGLKRIFFAGFFIQGHAYTMDTISVAVHFWSKGEAKAMFLRHEGFLGALGAFMSYENQSLDGLMVHKILQRFPISASSAGNKISCSLNSDPNGNESIECTVRGT